MINSVGSVQYLSQNESVQKSGTKKTQSTDTQSSIESRVDAIAKQINEGTYKIDLKALASKIADTLM